MKKDFIDSRYEAYSKTKLSLFKSSDDLKEKISTYDNKAVDTVLKTAQDLDTFLYPFILFSSLLNTLMMRKLYESQKRQKDSSFLYQFQLAFFVLLSSIVFIFVLQTGLNLTFFIFIVVLLFFYRGFKRFDKFWFIRTNSIIFKEFILAIQMFYDDVYNNSLNRNRFMDITEKQNMSELFIDKKFIVKSIVHGSFIEFFKLFSYDYDTNAIVMKNCKDFCKYLDTQYNSNEHFEDNLVRMFTNDIMKYKEEDI